MHGVGGVLSFFMFFVAFSLFMYVLALESHAFVHTLGISVYCDFIRYYRPLPRL